VQEGTQEAYILMMTKDIAELERIIRTLKRVDIQRDIIMSDCMRRPCHVDDLHKQDPEVDKCVTCRQRDMVSTL